MPHSKQMAFGRGNPRRGLLDGICLKRTGAEQTEEATLCIAHFKLKAETSKENTSLRRERESAAEPQPKHQTSFELVKRPSMRRRRGDLETLCLLRRGRLRDIEGANAEKRGRGEERNGVW